MLTIRRLQPIKASQPEYTCFDPTAAELAVAVGCYSGVESAVPPMIDVDCLALMPLV